MKKLISLPLILLILNFNAQNDGDIYNIKSYVSDNIELIKNINPEKVKDRIKFNNSLRTHILRNSGLIDSYLFQFRLNKELKLKMSNNQNYIKIKKRTIFSSVVGTFYIISSITAFAIDPWAGSIFFLIITPVSLLLEIIPLIGIGKIRAQLLKDYFLLVNQTF